ncbi:F-box/LRR-repeat protein [Raphanus sativus]|nr:F-box/LRR-repeat protein [Raphanus sativus]
MAVVSDFISLLPDAILHHILSYIPTEYAIRTSVLSKRWKHVWRETPSLSFHCHMSDHPDSITKTLATNFTAPKLTSFHIHVTFNNFDLTSSHIHSWIELAVSRHAEKISLVVIGSGSDNVLCPDFFFSNSSEGAQLDFGSWRL